MPATATACATTATPSTPSDQPSPAAHRVGNSHDHKWGILAILDKAALALWDYAARSAAWALGHATGDPLAETTPRRARPLPRRAHPHPDPRPLPAQPPRRTPRTGAPHARCRRPRPAPADAHSRSPRRTLARHTSQPLTPASFPDRPGPAPDLPANQRRAPPLPAAQRPNTRWPLVVRSFAPLITTHNGAAITTLDVRQHRLALRRCPTWPHPNLRLVLISLVDVFSLEPPCTASMARPSDP